jgi:hypothetical protein
MSGDPVAGVRSDSRVHGRGTESSLLLAQATSR